MMFTPNYTSDEELAFFGQPGVAARSRSLPREQLTHLVRDLKQFQRAENGERMRPDAINNAVVAPTVANKLGYPEPFAPRDTHRPDRANDAELMTHLRQMNQRIEDEALTYDLQQKMGTDADQPLPEPDLRDQIAAAVNVHSAD